MAISRAQLAKELEPGLNALFGMEYARYENQHAEIFETESSERAARRSLLNLTQQATLSLDTEQRIVE